MQALTAEYDRAASPVAPRGTFVCPYCGRTLSRRLSKVKNPQKVFCNNSCRGKFVEREKLKENFLEGNDFKTEIATDDVRRVARFVIKKYLGPRYSFDELFQECLIVVWKYGRRAHNGKAKPGSFYMKAFEMGIKSFISRNAVPVEELCIEDSSEMEPLYIQPDGIDIVGAEILATIRTNAARKKNWAWFADYYLDGKKSSEIADAYGCDMRDVVAAISYLKRKLTDKFKQ